MAVNSFEMNDSLIALLGFAKKSRQMISGFEGVRRSLGKRSLAFVVIDASLTRHSREKILASAEKLAMPVYIANAEKPEKNLWEITGYKIIGLCHGSLATGFLSKIKQEN